MTACNTTHTHAAFLNLLSEVEVSKQRGVYCPPRAKPDLKGITLSIIKSLEPFIAILIAHGTHVFLWGDSWDPKVVLCEYSKFRIESNSYLLFESIRFETDATIRNFRILICDQPSDWDGLCLYFGSHKPLHSQSLNPVLRRARVCVCAPLPLLRPLHGGSCCRRQSRPWRLIAL